MNIEHAKIMLANLERRNDRETTMNGDGNTPTPTLPAPVRPSSALVQVIANAAMSTDYDLERMERLFTMHMAMEGRAEERLFDEAMARAQAAMKGVAADSDNSQTRSRYASYYALGLTLGAAG